MNNARRLLSTFLALALVATACGGGGSSDQEVIDAVAASMRAEGELPAAVDVDCMAEAMVTSLGGADGIEEDYGITLDDIQAGADVGEDIELSRDAAFSLTDAMWDCDLQEAMVSEMAGGMEEESARCLVNELDQDILKSMMAAELMSAADGAAVESQAQADLLPAMLEAMGECGIDLEQLGR